jgi:hypothetical protein
MDSERLKELLHYDAELVYDSAADRYHGGFNYKGGAAFQDAATQP